MFMFSYLFHFILIFWSPFSLIVIELCFMFTCLKINRKFSQISWQILIILIQFNLSFDFLNWFNILSGSFMWKLFCLVFIRARWSVVKFCRRVRWTIRWTWSSSTRAWNIPCKWTKWAPVTICWSWITRWRRPKCIVWRTVSTAGL